jgi:hypothetical protein
VFFFFLASMLWSSVLVVFQQQHDSYARPGNAEVLRRGFVSEPFLSLSVSRCERQ